MGGGNITRKSPETREEREGGGGAILSAFFPLEKKFHPEGWWQCRRWRSPSSFSAGLTFHAFISLSFSSALCCVAWYGGGRGGEKGNFFPLLFPSVSESAVSGERTGDGALLRPFPPLLGLMQPPPLPHSLKMPAGSSLQPSLSLSLSLDVPGY